MVHLIANRLYVAGNTDVGLVRTLNEDHFRIEPSIRLLIVADGMGGHDDGEVASEKVIDSMAFSLEELVPRFVPVSAFPDEEDEEDGEDTENSTLPIDLIPQNEGALSAIDIVTESIKLANTELNSFNQFSGYSDGSGMGSTIVGIWIPTEDERPVLFHVGDSRAYLWRRGKLKVLTQDHTLYQHWLNIGKRGQEPPHNIILQAMGPSEEVAPDVHYQDFQPGDLLLLCSDGLTGMISDQMITESIQNITSESQLEEGCSKLIDLAKQHGGRDNVTVILGYVIR